MIKRMLISLFGLALLTGTAFAGSMTITDSDLDGVSAQGLQVIDNENGHLTIAEQNNNLDSVQLNNSAQEMSIVNGIINSAKSAVNASANILVDYNPPTQPPPPSEKYFGHYFSQSNTNVAINHVNTANDVDAEEELAVAINLNKETQKITNVPVAIIGDQDNNNNSVQLNDNAQRGSQGVSIINSSNSALNFGANYFVAGDVSTPNGGYQTNIQVARNMSNYAEAQAGEAPKAKAGNAEIGPTQTINNAYGVEDYNMDGVYDYVSDVKNQDNNNNSVQVNDNAQENAMVQAIMNSAQSATNASGNLASMGDVTGSYIAQSNNNTAENHVNVAKAEAGGGIAKAGNLNKQTQNIHNMEAVEMIDDLYGLIDDQDNNNNSVQLNNSAQRHVQGILLENTAMSAVNAALNLMGTGNVSASTLSQTNIQVARNYENTADAYPSGVLAIAANAELSKNPGQFINNVHATIKDQDNNNNSVQLNDNAQKDIVVDKTINSAKSAVNVGQNIMKLGDVTDSTISQSNNQYAGNHNNYATSSGCSVAANINKQTQIVDNCFCTNLTNGRQDNNMNSVQISENAQMYAKGMVIVNAADSAVNGALNVITAGTVTGSSMTQSNTNTAVNFSNSASGKTAIAKNAEFFKL